MEEIERVIKELPSKKKGAGSVVLRGILLHPQRADAANFTQTLPEHRQRRKTYN